MVQVVAGLQRRDTALQADRSAVVVVAPAHMCRLWSGIRIVAHA